jgi:hypothetical protein
LLQTMLVLLGADANKPPPVTQQPHQSTCTNGAAFQDRDKVPKLCRQSLSFISFSVTGRRTPLHRLEVLSALALQNGLIGVKTGQFLHDKLVVGYTRVL